VDSGFRILGLPGEKALGAWVVWEVDWNFRKLLFDSFLSFLSGFDCSFQGKLFSIFQLLCRAALLLVFFLSSNINFTVLVKSLLDAFLFFVILFRCCWASFLGDVRVVLLMQAGLSKYRPPFTWKYICHTIDCGIFVYFQSSSYSFSTLGKWNFSNLPFK